MNSVEIFEKIRDIPYRIPLSLEEHDDCCIGKHIRLKEEFEKMGYEARYRVCSFKWTDGKLPQYLLDKLTNFDCEHLYLEVKLDGKWVVVDATWDNGLKGLFCINEWDGKTDTKIQVPVEKIFNPEESMQEFQKITSGKFLQDDLDKNREFYKAFNEWLAENRK